ncbi:hypothetical protein ACFFGH_14850 [Lysobacter korlensis]|uniref:Serine aminopeptidase S33 domain-containing protein n=1 Tax=Lysobacter korlensis TaxID=553636 RepID=A0ABV6RQ69_9GAMM
MSIGTFEPFWIGEGSRSLYAALHMPDTRPFGATGVLCVPPLLHEQPRSRRFITETASAFAALGLPCLRFDFRGTGDSFGRGDDVDFAAMHADLTRAVAALKSRAAVERVALMAWRGAALPALTWLQGAAHVDRLVLWEPITDGMGWLSELERQDAGERAARPRPRPGVPRTADADDGQLMGFAASRALRRELSATSLQGPVPHGIEAWAVTREATTLPIEVARNWALPAGAPTFAGGASMEAALFLSPTLEGVVNEIGHALRDSERVAA